MPVKHDGTHAGRFAAISAFVAAHGEEALHTLDWCFWMEYKSLLHLEWWMNEYPLSVKTELDYVDIALLTKYAFNDGYFFDDFENYGDDNEG